MVSIPYEATVQVQGPTGLPSEWEITRGDDPILAVSLHSGGGLRLDSSNAMGLPMADRMREEDPFTDLWTHVARNRIVGLHSRFEFDLNRPREKAVYRCPEDAWGLKVWNCDVPEAVFERSLAAYDAFYANVTRVYDEMLMEHERIVVLDFHSYNHRRGGPSAEPACPDTNPVINLGTGSLNRAAWGSVVGRFASSLRTHHFMGQPLDVRENIKFFGGHFARWSHMLYPDRVCVLAIEAKKVFMDEWTGEPDLGAIGQLGGAFQWAAAEVRDLLAHW